jgi:hypothetical protein
VGIGGQHFRGLEALKERAESGHLQGESVARSEIGARISVEVRLRAGWE